MAVIGLLENWISISILYLPFCIIHLLHLKMDVENCTVWSDIWSGFRELGSKTIQGIPRQGVHWVVESPLTIRNSPANVWPIMAHFHSDVEPLSKYSLVMLHLSPATGINS